jgi:predicted ATPase
MLKSLDIKNFTVFTEETLHFGKNVNVIVGENGTGKSHLLKAIYAGLAKSHEYLVEKQKNPRFDGFFEMSSRLNSMLGSETAYSLIRRVKSNQPLSENDSLKLNYHFSESSLDFSLEITPFELDEENSPNSDGLVSEFPSAYSATTPPRTSVPKEFVSKQPIYLPTRELLSIYPNFLALFDSSYVPFEASWRDACVHLGKGYSKTPVEPELQKILKQIENAMGGTLRLDESGRFYLSTSIGKIEMHMVSEGWRKLGMIAQLIANSSLTPGSALLWDEPEANLNARLIKLVAKIITYLSSSGIQVFIATHSLFLLRELHIVQKTNSDLLKNRYFGLVSIENGVTVKQGDTMDEVGDLAALDEEIDQADRYIDSENNLLPRK